MNMKTEGVLQTLSDLLLNKNLMADFNLHVEGLINESWNHTLEHSAVFKLENSVILSCQSVCTLHHHHLTKCIEKQLEEEKVEPCPPAHITKSC